MADTQNAYKTATLCTLLLILKTIYSNLALGAGKLKAGARAKEDNYQNQGPASSESLERLDRLQRCVNNDLENIPYGLVAIWVCYLGLGSANEADVQSHIALTILFTMARYLHTIFYECKASYLRTVAYLLGLIGILGLSILSVALAWA
ncbi:unnamed protein product [Heterosigma akashiwo]